MYVHDIKSGITVSNVEPKVIRDNAATAHVDGNNVLGPVVGNFCMDIALKKCKDAGVGFVVAKGMNCRFAAALLINLSTARIVNVWKLHLIILLVRLPLTCSKVDCMVIGKIRKLNSFGQLT